ncbi:MAG: hypothetical protein AAGE96_13040, partial [Cyanobacteria bacterium P01_G01_bin.19]
KKSSTKFIAISSLAGTFNVVVNLVAIPDVLASSDADYSFTIIADWQDCQQINREYQAVYAFETKNFYINICQKDNTYFYSGQSKQRGRSSIFIPAYPVDNDNGSSFRADNGNVSYLVVLPFLESDSLDASVSKPSEAILTIKRNNKLVAIESSLNKYCHPSDSNIVWDTIELEPENSNHVAAVPQHQDVGIEFSTHQSERLLSTETFNSDSRFDFYRIGGELHRLTTCN